MWSAGSLIRTLILSAANCPCRYVYLHSVLLYSPRVRNMGRVWRLWDYPQGYTKVGALIFSVARTVTMCGALRMLLIPTLSSEPNKYASEFQAKSSNAPLFICGSFSLLTKRKFKCISYTFAPLKDFSQTMMTHGWGRIHPHFWKCENHQAVITFSSAFIINPLLFSLQIRLLLGSRLTS